jgi:hypothetical protein
MSTASESVAEFHRIFAALNARASAGANSAIMSKNLEDAIESRELADAQNVLKFAESAVVEADNVLQLVSRSSDYSTIPNLVRETLINACLAEQKSRIARVAAQIAALCCP